MRTRLTTEHDDELEAVPIDADGRLVDPPRASPSSVSVAVHAGRSAAASLWQHSRALLTGTLPPATHTPKPGVGPWLPTTSADGPPPPRSTRLPPTFTRLVEVHPARLGELPQWFDAAAATEGEPRVRIKGLSLGAPTAVRAGVWRQRGRLRGRWRLRSIPVELLLWAHLGSWTKLRLEPERAVHVSRRYFSAGHRALDVLTARLRTELGAPTS